MRIKSFDLFQHSAPLLFMLAVTGALAIGLAGGHQAEKREKQLYGSVFKASFFDKLNEIEFGLIDPWADASHVVAKTRKRSPDLIITHAEMDIISGAIEGFERLAKKADVSLDELEKSIQSAQIGEADKKALAERIKDAQQQNTKLRKRLIE